MVGALDPVRRGSPKYRPMSRVIAGWVVGRSDGLTTLPWYAWRSGETRLVADTYRGLLAMIRDRNAR
jgi:hypothetical protein